MKSMSTTLALIVSTTLVVAAFAGCDSSKSNTSAGNDLKITSPTTLTVEIFDRSNAPKDGGTCDNNWETQQIQEMFGKANNVTLKYVPVPRAQEVTKLNILMASNSAPDICFTYHQDVFFNYAVQGGLTDLSDLVNKAANLKSYEGDNLKNGKFNGKTYAIPAKRSVIAKHVDYIRTDLLDKVGMKAPANADEFEAVMKAFKNLGGGIIPYGLVNTTNNSVDLEFGADHLIKSFVDPNVSDQDLQTLPDIKLPGYKEGVQFLNKLYNEGLIDPSFALDQNDSKLKQNISTGKIGFYDYDNDWNWAGGDDSVEAALEKNVPDAKFEPVNVFKNKAGKYMHSVYSQAGMYIMVPKTSKNAVAAVKYLDWMSTPAAAKFVNWGKEGIEYTLDASGLPDQSKADQKVVNTQFWNKGDLSILFNGVYAPSADKVDQMVGADTTDYSKYAPEVQKSNKIAMTDAYQDYSKIPAFDRPIDAISKYQANLDQLYGNNMIKCIMTRPSDFSSMWDSFVKQYMDNGGQAVQDGKLAAYKEQNK